MGQGLATSSRRPGSRGWAVGLEALEGACPAPAACVLSFWALLGSGRPEAAKVGPGPVGGTRGSCVSGTIPPQPQTHNGKR